MSYLDVFSFFRAVCTYHMALTTQDVKELQRGQYKMHNRTYGISAFFIDSFF